MFLQLGDLVLSAMMSEFVHRPAREASAALSKPSTGRFYSELNSSRCRQGPLQGRNVLNYPLQSLVVAALKHAANGAAGLRSQVSSIENMQFFVDIRKNVTVISDIRHQLMGIRPAIFQRAVQLWLGLQCSHRCFNFAWRVAQKRCYNFLRRYRRRVTAQLPHPVRRI
jgi:hypothetical protein